MLLVAHAGNAVEAIAEFRRHRPDVTLMDLRLPGTDGTDILIAIRGEYRDARVIMLTTSDETETRISGATLAISGPFLALAGSRLATENYAVNQC